MPILPEEPSAFPVDLFAPETMPSDRQWWVLHTKPRQEKALARQLVDSEIAFYLPLLERKTVIRGKIVPSQIPLFTSYVFLLGTAEDRVRALGTKRIVRTLDVPNPDELWGDLRQISQLIALGQPVTPEQNLYPGALVEIRLGPLAGLRGKILREAGRHRFMVQVNFIQQGASVVLDDYTLAAIKEGE